MIIAISSPIILISGLHSILLVIFSIGLSLSPDETAAWITYSEYPRKREFLITLALFLFITTYAFLIYYFLA